MKRPGDASGTREGVPAEFGIAACGPLPAEPQTAHWSSPRSAAPVPHGLDEHMRKGLVATSDAIRRSPLGAMAAGPGARRSKPLNGPGTFRDRQAK